MIIGLSGLAGSGKSTIARMLVRNHCFEEVLLSAPLKFFCAEVFGLSRDQLYGSSRLRDVVDARLGFAPREPLLRIGDIVREMYSDAFAECALREARNRMAHFRADGVVISDVRYQNELDAIRKVGGNIWRVVRPGAGLVGPSASHKTETELTDVMPFDRVINNAGGTLEELERLVARAITGAA